MNEMDQNEFDQLADAWTQETSHLSNPRQRQLHPAYQQIVAMGDAVIPHLLQRMYHSREPWFMMLEDIVGSAPEPMASPHHGTIREKIRDWRYWGWWHGYKIDPDHLCQVCDQVKPERDADGWCADCKRAYDEALRQDKMAAAEAYYKQHGLVRYIDPLLGTDDECYAHAPHDVNCAPNCCYHQHQDPPLCPKGIVPRYPGQTREIIGWKSWKDREPDDVAGWTEVSVVHRAPQPGADNGG